MSDTDHPELVEFEGETLGDTITNLLAEIIRLRNKKADFMESQLAKMAGALAYEGREALDELQDVEFYLWFIEAWGTHEDMEHAEIQEEEE